MTPLSSSSAQRAGGESLSRAADPADHPCGLPAAPAIEEESGPDWPALADNAVIVDVHAHYLPASCIAPIPGGARPQPYAVHIAEPVSGDVLYSGAGAAEGCDAEQLFSLKRRRDDMQRQGVDRQVLSVPPPFGFFYELDPPRSLAICRALNDALAQAAAGDPTRFIALATVPLQSPDGAAGELERSVKELGLRGAEIGTNVGGKNLDDAGLGPVYAKAQALGVPLFIHSTRSRALGGDRLQRYHLGNLVGNPTEDAVAAACLIFGGVLEEFPRLKVYLAHGGGSCPFLAGRWDRGWQVRPEAKLRIPRPPSEYLGRLLFDSLTHSRSALGFLVEAVGAERVLLGSDYPYDMGEPNPVGTVTALPRLSDRERALILGQNAAELFQLG
ncbi:MAG: amidohydrolase [Chloroflexota bacterium]|nr:amidohydrolase [Chloroflexota bacterium]